MSRIRRILHPSDFSRASGAAFAKAVELAKANRAELLLMHVMTPIDPTAGYGYLSPKVYAEVEARVRSGAQKQLDQLTTKARNAGVRARSLLQEGLADERITRSARTQRADLIVIGTHGRTGLARLFLGSVASRVVTHAHCPVLTVRGK